MPPSSFDSSSPAELTRSLMLWLLALVVHQSALLFHASPSFAPESARWHCHTVTHDRPNGRQRHRLAALVCSISRYLPRHLKRWIASESQRASPSRLNRHGEYVHTRWSSQGR